MCLALQLVSAFAVALSLKSNVRKASTCAQGSGAFQVCATVSRNPSHFVQKFSNRKRLNQHGRCSGRVSDSSIISTAHKYITILHGIIAYNNTLSLLV